ncbi:MAG: glycosyltransferase family 4 protein [Candidatus Brocadiia bacterium]
MKVTICCKRFGPSGGAEKFLANFARCLLDEGHHVKVLAAELDGNLDGMTAEPLRLAPLPRTFRDLALARASGKALQREDADVTFSDQKCWGAQIVRPGGGVQREYVRQRSKTFRSPTRRALKQALYAVSIREKLRIFIDDRLYRAPGPRLVVANSRMVREDLLVHYPHLEGRVRVIYNGVDPERFHPGLRDEHREVVRRELDLPAEALVCIFVGTGWRRKGLSTLLEALGLLARRELPRPVYGLVVGRGNEKRARETAEAHEAGELVRFVGWQEPDRYYGAADLFVLPTYFDPCANSTLEALACGLPAITSAYNGAHELLTPGREGFFIPEAHEAGRVAAFVEHFMEPERLRRAGQAACQLALKHTLQRQWGELEEALRTVADGN